VRPSTFALVAWLASGSLAIGCAAGPVAPPRAAHPAEPRWQDAFDETSELLVVVRPKELRRDKVYGPLLKRTIELARERNQVVSATPLEAIEDADEVVIGVHPGPRGDDAATPNVILVIVGVRADIDPGALTDGTGHALWAPGPTGAVRELNRERDERGFPMAASLFELPGRTWVIASGEARAPAREAFAHPFQKPALDLDPAALAIVRFDGPSLVGRVRALQTLGSHAAIGRRLRALTLRLPPGATAEVQITLAYADEDAAAFAEVAAREAVDAITRKKPEHLAWLAGATVDRTGNHVEVKLPLPRTLVEGLLHAGSAEVGATLPAAGAAP